MDAKEQAVKALQLADVGSEKLTTGKDRGMIRALTGIGYALLYLGDVIKEDRKKYAPPF